MSDKELLCLDQKLENGTDDNNEVEIDLMELFYRVVENAKKIIAVGLIGMIVLGFYSFVLATPMYEATCKLYVMSASDSAVNLSDLQIGAYLTSDYQEVFDTWEVHEKVLSDLGLDYTYRQLESMISVTNPSDTRILYITITSDDPQEAMDMANKYAEVASSYIALTMKTDQPSILSAALLPSDPVSPHKLLNMVLGLFLGVLIMTAIVIIQFLTDDKIKTAEDIRKYVDMPTLAVVPTNGEFEAPAHERSGKGARKQRG